MNLILLFYAKFFQPLEKAKLMVKPSKVSLCKSSVSFLGFILDDKGVSPDPAKIAALVDASPPRTPKQVRQFLGAAGFMRAFIPHFSQIARPLHALTKKDHKFEWTQDCDDDAFDLLKRRLTEAPVLRYPAPHFPYKLFTDASKVGLGAVLTQDFPDGTHPILYLSRALNQAEKNLQLLNLNF